MMRSFATALRIGLTGAAALAVTGCGSPPAASNNAVTEMNASTDLSAPMNDASAMEAAGNASIAPPPAEANMTNSADTVPLPPSEPTTGEQSNVTGM